MSAHEVSLLGLQLGRQSGSPTEMMFTNLGHKNTTVDQLAFHLLKAGLIRAANVLHGLVPDSVFNNIGDPISLQTVFEDLQPNGGSNIPGLPLPQLPPAAPFSKLVLPVYPVAQPKAVDKQQYDSQINAVVKSPFVNGSGTRSSNVYLDEKPVALQPGSEKAVTPSTPAGLKVDYDLKPDVETTADNETVRPEENWRRPLPVESLDDQPTVNCTCPPGSNKGVNVPTSLPSAPPPTSALPANLAASVVQYKFSEITIATQNFSESHVIGCGGFGVVYCATLKNTRIAIKKLHNLTSESSPDFLAEICALQKYRHQNVITLYGVSIDGPNVCLVYEFMKNGSLLDRLECRNKSEPLSVLLRLNILRDAASGLQYLHTVSSGPLIHGDIKSANILLGSHFEAKISDFGLAKEATGRSSTTGPYTHVTRDKMADIYGSMAYLPLDILSYGCHYNVKTDVYSFGVVIFETCTGLKVFDPKRKEGDRLTSYVSAMFSDSDRQKLLSLRDRRAGDWPGEHWLALLNIGHRCTAERKKNRPAMIEVLGQLENLLSQYQKYTSSSVNKSNAVMESTTGTVPSTERQLDRDAGNHGDPRVPTHTNVNVQLPPLQSPAARPPTLVTQPSSSSDQYSTSDTNSPSVSATTDDDSFSVLHSDDSFSLSMLAGNEVDISALLRKDFHAVGTNDIEYENEEERAATRQLNDYQLPTDSDRDFSEVGTTEDDEDFSVALQVKKQKPFPDFFMGDLDMALGDSIEDGNSVSDRLPSTRQPSSSPSGAVTTPPVYKQAGTLSSPSTAGLTNTAKFLPPPLDGAARERSRQIVGPPSLAQEDLERIAKLELLKASLYRET